MAADEGISSFTEWANSLHCPQSKWPNKKALRMIFRQQAQIVPMTIVKPVVVLKDTRQQLLAQQFKIYKERNTTMPPSVAKYQKLKNLKAALKNVNENCNTLKRKVLTTESKVRKLLVKNTTLSHSQEEKQVQQVLIDSHMRQLQLKTEDETRKNTKFKQAFPNPGATKTKNTQNEIEKCLATLNEYYARRNNNETDIKKEKEIWDYLFKSLYNHQKIDVYGVAIKMQETALETLQSMYALKSEKVKPESYSKMETAVVKINVEELKCLIWIQGYRNKIMNVKEASDEAMNTFACTIEETLHDDSSDMVNKFVLEVAKNISNEAKQQLLAKELKYLQRQVLEYTETTANKKPVQAKAYEMYGESEQLTTNLVNEVGQLKKIVKEVDVIVKNIDESVQRWFKIKNDTSLNVSMIPHLSMISRQSSTQKENYSSEIACFKQLPLWKVKAKRFSNGTNHFMDKFVLHQMVDGLTAAHISLLYNNFSGIEAKMHSLTLTSDHSDTYLRPISFECFKVDPDRLSLMENMSFDAVLETLDAIKTVNHTNTVKLPKVEMLLEHLIENPLRKFVPSRLFNGRLYKEYENEYMMHYTMFTNKIR